MSRKTHKDLGQSSLLPLQLNKVKLTLHRHSFYFDYTEIASYKLYIHLKDRHISNTDRI